MGPGARLRPRQKEVGIFHLQPAGNGSAARWAKLRKAFRYEQLVRAHGSVPVSVSDIPYHEDGAVPTKTTGGGVGLSSV